MKIFAFLLLIGFAAATTEWKWESGKEYHFEYSGRLLTGIPALASQYSGVGINSTVVLNVRQPQQLSMTIKEPKFVRINDLLEPVEDNVPDTYDGTNWRRLRLPSMTEVPQEYQEILARPVIIELASNGEVRKVVISKEEPEWSVNYKKALVTLFQTKLDATSFELEENRLEGSVSEEARNHWRVKEETIAGRCESVYQVNEIPEYMVRENPTLIPYPEACEERKFFEVTRTVDYQRCEKLASFTYYQPGRFACGGSGENINNCGPMLTRSSSTRYIACGPRPATAGTSRGRLVIQTIINDGEFNFNLMGTRTEKMVSGSLQILRLKEVRTSSSFPQPSDPVTLETLMFEYTDKAYGYNGGNSISEQLMSQGRIPKSELSDGKVLSHSRPRTFFQGVSSKMTPSMSEYKEEIKQLLNEVMTLIRGESGSLSESQINMKLLTSARGLTSLKSAEEIHQLYKEIINSVNSEDHKVTLKQLFVDSIIMSGTPQAFYFVDQMIRQNELPRSEINNLFMWMPHYVVIPTKEVLERLFKLVTEAEQVTQHPTTYSVALTGFAQLIQSACISESRKTAYPTSVFGEFCTPESEIVQDRLIPYLVRQLHASGSSQSQEEENIRNIHIVALGLLRHKTVITELTPLVEGSLEQPAQGTKTSLSRILAIYSLSNAGYANPNLVIPVLVSVFTNPAESTEMRIIAFNALLKINPPMHVFHTIASVTQNEPSMDYELLKTINIALYTLGHEVPTTRLSEKMIQLISKARSTYALIKKTYGIVPTTGTWYKTEFLRELGTGYEAYINWISGQESILPKNAFLSVTYFFESYYLNAFQIGYRLTGADSLLDKISHESSRLQGSQIKEQIRRGLSSEWSKVIDKLHLKTRESDELTGSFFFRLFQSGTFFKSFNERTSERLHSMIKEAIRSPRSFLSGSQSTHLNIQKTFDLSPMEMLHPSDMGFPVLMEYHAPITVSLVGSGSVDPQTQVPGFTVTGKALFTNQMTGYVGTISPFTEEYVISGMNQHSVINIPGKVEVKLNVQSQKLSVFVKPNAESSSRPVDLFHYHVMPYTVHEKIQRLVPITTSPNMKPIRATGAPTKNLSYEFGQYLGLNFQTSIKTESRFTDFRSYLELFQIYKNPLNMMLFGWTSPALSEHMTPSVRNHRFTIRYQPSQSSTKEVGVEVKFGCASKMSGEEVKYHILKKSSESSESSEELMANPTISNILKSLSPYKVGSEALESSSVHPTRQRKISQAMKEIEVEDATGFSIVSNLILKGSRPKTLTYSLTAAVGQKQDEPRKIKQKWNVQLEGQSDSPLNKVCVTGDLSLPLLPMWNVNDLRSAMVDFHFTNKMLFGASSCGESKVITTGAARVSHQQKQFSQESPEAKECQRLSQQGIRGSLTSHVCEKVRLQASSIDEIDFKTQFVNVPKNISVIEGHIVSYLKAYLWPYYTPSRSEVKSGSSWSQSSYSTNTKLSFKQYTPSYDMVISRPSEVLYFKDVHINYPFDLFFPLKATRNNMRLSVEKLVLGSSVGQSCRVDSKTVTSYDNKTLAFNPDKCFHMLTADCSKYHRFGVTTRTLEGDKKEVKIFLKKTVVEIIPESSSSHGPKVIVDGQSMEVPVYKIVKVTGLIGNTRKTIATLTRTVDGVVVVKSPELMLNELRTNGKLIQVIPSPLLKNKLCGLCGDFNNQIKGDVSGPRQCIYSKPELEVASYRIPSESCSSLPSSIRFELRKETEQCAKYHIRPSMVAKSYKVSTGKCTLLRHLTLQRPGQLCISKVPVTQCSPSCKSERSQTVSKSVPFVCLPQGRLADHYMRKVQSGESLEELSSMETTFSTSIEQPRNCVHALTSYYSSSSSSRL